MSMLPKTCSVVSRNTAGTAMDDDGNIIPVNAGTVSVACDIQQVTSQEPGDQGEFSISGWVGFFPTGTTLDTSDRVTEASMGTFEVVGRPWDANQGSAAVNHVEAHLKEAA